jgi:hypothetical protein
MKPAPKQIPCPLVGPAPLFISNYFLAVQVRCFSSVIRCNQCLHQANHFQGGQGRQISREISECANISGNCKTHGSVIPAQLRQESGLSLFGIPDARQRHSGMTKRFAIGSQDRNCTRDISMAAATPLIRPFCFRGLLEQRFALPCPSYTRTFLLCSVISFIIFHERG